MVSNWVNVVKNYGNTYFCSIGDTLSKWRRGEESQVAFKSGELTFPLP
jgi:hypothetical protein